MFCLLSHGGKWGKQFTAAPQTVFIRNLQATNVTAAHATQIVQLEDQEDGSSDHFNIMKKTLIFINALIVIMFSAGCMNVKYNFAYKYEDLRNDLVRAELIYIEKQLQVFSAHWPSNIEEFDHTLIGVFSEDDFDDLTKSIVDLPFRYEVWYFLASQQASYYIDGYAIALYYANDSRILIGKTAEHRKNTTRWLAQDQVGRYVKDDIWNDFIDSVSTYNFAPDYP